MTESGQTTLDGATVDLYQYDIYSEYETTVLRTAHSEKIQTVFI